MDTYNRHRNQQTTSYADRRYRSYVQNVTPEGVVGEAEVVADFTESIPNSRAWRYCSDTVGKRDQDNDFYLDYGTSDIVNARITDVRTFPGLFPWDPSQRWTTERSEPVQLYGFHERDGLTDQQFITKAFADTNPSAAKVDLAVFIAELRDLPGLFKNIGSSMSKYGANEYLKYQYGWRPLIKDLRKLFDVLDHFDKRLNTVLRLHQYGSVKRRYEELPLYSYSGPMMAWLPTPGLPVTEEISIPCSGQFTQKRWAVLKWKADLPESFFAVSADIKTSVRRALFGGTIDGATLWQLMPWSWLIDWSTNLGDYIDSQRNIVGAVPASSCLMKETSVYGQASGSSSGSWDPPEGGPSMHWTCSVSSGQFRYVLKERIVGLMPEAENTGLIDIFDGNYRKSILGALALQRLRRLPI